MGLKEKRVKAFEERAHWIAPVDSGVYIAGGIPEIPLRRAIESYAIGFDGRDIVGMIDDSRKKDGSSGFVFTRSKIYCSSSSRLPEKIWLDEIESMRVVAGKGLRRFDSLELTMRDGSKCLLGKKGYLPDKMRELVEVLMALRTIEGSDECLGGVWLSGAISRAESVEAAMVGPETVKLAREKFRFRGRQGHGFAAEAANNKMDRAMGKDARIVGNDFAKNGADRRIVNPNGSDTYIQSKYCKTGRECIDACFDSDGAFRYTKDGVPMAIEVPKDKFDDAVRALEKRIREGRFSGVDDPAVAKQIVRPGHFDYETVVRIAKAGTIESIAYDSASGMVVAAPVMGVSAAITFATCVWSGADFEASARESAVCGLKVGGRAVASSVVASQMARTALNEVVVSGSEALARALGKEACTALVKAYEAGSCATRAAAIENAGKLIYSNAVTAAATMVVLSAVEIANAFRGRISGSQLMKNLASAGAGVVGGAGGGMAGAAAGGILVPGVGAIIGGVVGVAAGGLAASLAVDAASSFVYEEDADRMVSLMEMVFRDVAEANLLNADEAEKSLDGLSAVLDAKMIKEMYASKDRARYAYSVIPPIVDDVVSRRGSIALPSGEVLLASLG